LFETTKLTVPSSNNSIEAFLFLLISALWVVYPILAIKPYKNIVSSGYRPRSIDYHVFSTSLIIFGIILRYRYNLTSDHQHVSVVIITILVLFGGLSIKIIHYTELLNQEIIKSTA
jgi:hypothetical protein